MRLIYVLGPLAFLAVAVVVWAVLLPACAAASWLGGVAAGSCPAEGPGAARRGAEAEIARGRALEAELRSLERELAALGRCPVERADPSAVEPDRWADRDLSLLEGCWQLDSDYRMRNLGTGEDEPVEGWRACFGPDGQGTQEFSFPGGVQCEGPMSAAFAEDGALSLRDGGDLPCSDGNPILRREGECRLDARSRIACGIGDDEAQADVRLRRAE